MSDETTSGEKGPHRARPGKAKRQPRAAAAGPAQSRAGKPHGAHRSKSWDAVADWYSGWSGSEGSYHHQQVAIPALLELLQVAAGEAILDIGCGAGALASSAVKAGVRYTGVDLSPKLIEVARRHHKACRFHVGDATRLASVTGLRRGSFDGATFLLSLQDIDPLDEAVASTAWALRPGGRLALLMIHPCFRIPRQSGWGWDVGRGLRYRRVDRYLTPLDIPMQEYDGGRKGTTRSYHRPLQDYVAALAAAGFVVEALCELSAPAPPKGAEEKRAERISREEIPMFLGLRARLVADVGAPGAG